MSKKVTVVTKDGVVTATAEEAKLMDVVTTLISSDQALTGTYAFLQKGLLVGGGMVLQEYRRSGSLNPL